MGQLYCSYKKAKWNNSPLPGLPWPERSNSTHPLLCKNHRWCHTPVPKGESTDGKCCHLDLPAVEMFQDNVATVFGKLNGLSGIADDPFVYGKSEKGYDQHILNVLDAAGDNNVRFNPDEVQFKVDQTSFWEFTWTPDGLRADDLKIKQASTTCPPTEPCWGADLYGNGQLPEQILPHHRTDLGTPTTIDEERHTLFMTTRAPQSFPEC